MTRIINLNDFNPQLSEGRVAFLILKAQYDEINTVRGPSDVLKVDIELTKPDDQTKKLIKKNYLLFIDFTQRSLFHQFFISAKQVLNSKDFTADNLIGLKGEVELKYYQKEGSNYAYERLFDWQFKLPEEETEEALKRHFNDEKQEPLDFDVTDEDINF